MAGEEEAEEKEPNFYLSYLEGLPSRIRTAKTNIESSSANPGNAIKQLVDQDGWVCDAATSWGTELIEQTRKVMPAFDDAVDDVHAEISAEKSRFPDDGHKVPKGHPHGYAYNRSNAWRNRRVNPGMY